MEVRLRKMPAPVEGGCSSPHKRLDFTADQKQSATCVSQKRGGDFAFKRQIGPTSHFQEKPPSEWIAFDGSQAAKECPFLGRGIERWRQVTLDLTSDECIRVASIKTDASLLKISPVFGDDRKQAFVPFERQFWIIENAPQKVHLLQRRRGRPS